MSSWRERRRAADRLLRTPRYQRFRHRMMTRDEWLCRLCREAGMTVEARFLDHIVPRHKAPERLYDPDNVQALCEECHITKTLGEEALRYPHLRDPITVDPRFVDG